MKFEEYLQQQLEKPVEGWFDPDGDSARARVMRGITGSLKHEFKKLFPTLKSDLANSWDGIDTPLSFFLEVLILPFILPFLPFLRAWYSYNKAIKTYRLEYKNFMDGKK